MFEQPATAILHPTDFSEASEAAFAHALAIALQNKAKLTILHVVDDREQNILWHEYPSVRKTLERWGHLATDASREDIANKLGMKVKKAVGFDTDVVQAITGMTIADDFDLIVMATNENQQHPAWFKKSVSVSVSEKTHIPTLFVPCGIDGCVLKSDGTVSLNKVLLPVDFEPQAQSVLDRVALAISRFGGVESKVTLLHVGDADKFPELMPPDSGKIEWSRLNRQGNVAAEIVGAANESETDLIAMITEGKNGFWDSVRGSTVQQVLKHAKCPVFTMPAGL